MLLEVLAKWITKHEYKIAFGINLTLIVAISMSFAQTTLVVLDAMVPAGQLPQTLHHHESNEEQKYDGAPLSSMELFGKAEASVVSPETLDAPETQLNLILQGTFVSPEPSLSRALVSQTKQSGELYSVGDQLPGRAILTAINEQGVLLKRNGRLERLMFEDDDFVVQETRTTSAKQHSSTVTDTLATFKKRLRTEPSKTLDELGISAVEEGAAEGYKIDKNTGLLAKAGLQRGDVVRSVNGKPLGNVRDDASFIDQVALSSNARVEVQRGERRFYITVPVSGLN